MVKYLNHTLSVHTFFHESCDLGQIQLLTDKVFSAVPSNRLGCQKHHHNDHHGQNSQHRAERQHCDKSDHNGQRSHQHLWDGLVNHLSQGIGIIGVETHDGSIGVVIKIPDRQGLHMFKHLIPDSL